MEHVESTPQWVELEKARVSMPERPEWLFSLVESHEGRLGLWIYRGKPVIVVPVAEA